MSDEKGIPHLEALRLDARDEVKKRIEQRDKYSVQLTIALGAIVATAFSRPGLAKVLIAAPLVSIYFTVLILYSYRIHAILAQYMREALEPQLATRCGTSVDLEWETFYAKHEVSGIRKRFFVVALWVVTVGSLGYLWVKERADFLAVLIAATLIYVLAAILVVVFFSGKE